ncbi:MAG: elongation factor Ts [Patescibacteria group bacterium]|nr:elongation factor Ts [Patescibacteria group bacterium]
MNITAEQIKILRDKTGVSIMQCRKALEETGGDTEKAIVFLQEKSVEFANKKMDRELKAGTVSSYIHNNGTSGTILVLRSETDFVSGNEEFIKLAHDIAMHITAMKSESIDVLLGQSFIKNPEMTIKNLIDSASQKFGEKIELSNYSRYDVKE